MSKDMKAIRVNVILKNNKEGRVMVLIDVKKLLSLKNLDDRVQYIENETKRRYSDVKKVNFNANDLKNIFGKKEDDFDDSIFFFLTDDDDNDDDNNDDDDNDNYDDFDDDFDD